MTSAERRIRETTLAVLEPSPLESARQLMFIDDNDDDDDDDDDDDTTMVIKITGPSLPTHLV